MPLASPSFPALALLVPLLAACDRGGEGGTALVTTTGITSVTTAPATTTGATTEELSTGTDAATGTSTGGGTDGASGDTGPSATTEDTLKPDSGATGGTTGAPEPGCHKVDFLFVVDNSSLMAEEQARLITSFPGFIASVREELAEAQDYHVMVVDSDAWVFGGCETICPLYFDMCPGQGDDYECGVTEPEDCEDVLGAGVTHPRGEDASSKPCNFASKARYMDVSEPNLAAAFACAAKVGTGSSDDPERPMQAMIEALAPKGEAADCNLGFLRPDAILVVTFITDEDDNLGDGSLGSVDDWHEAVIAAKRGDDTALVVLGLFGDQDKPNAICKEDAEHSPRLRQFVESFGDRGVAGSVCAPSYKEFFKNAVGIIDTTCDGFIPPPM
jgi:hypothetical protein